MNIQVNELEREVLLLSLEHAKEVLKETKTIHPTQAKKEANTLNAIENSIEDLEEKLNAKDCDTCGSFSSITYGFCLNCGDV